MRPSEQGIGLTFERARAACLARWGVSPAGRHRERLGVPAVCVLTAVCALLVGSAVFGLPGRAAHTRPRVRSGSLSTLPLAARGVVSSVLGRDDRRFWVQRAGGRLAAWNPAQRLTVRFSGAGVSLAAPKGRVALAVAGVGYGEHLRALPSGVAVARRNRVALDYGALAEWFVNGPLGLEQGFTVRRAPAGARHGPLSIVMRAWGSLGVRLTPGARAAVLVARGGRVALRYAGLRATDASGRALDAWLVAGAGRLAIRVDDRSARYPLTIDPFVQQGSKLVGAGATPNAGQGGTVALSADGSTALVGAPRDNGGVGAAWVFVRSGRTWRQQGRKLVGTGATGPVAGATPNAGQGSSVALSAHGNTALIGGVSDNYARGAAWVFVRSGGTWREQGPKLVGRGATGHAFQGSSVALSADGSTALVGGPFDNGGVGAAWVFVRSGGTWSQQGRKLVGTGRLQGSSVALSASGSTALIGGPSGDGGVGAAGVFVRSRTTWSQQGPALVGVGATPDAGQGASVALSADGSAALVGGPGDNGGVGAAWVFVRSGRTWRQQGPKLVGADATGNADQGASVALSQDGSTALIGGPLDNNEVGAAWVFVRLGGTWSQQGPKLVGRGATGQAQQGTSVALSTNGSTALVGAPGDNNDVGATWVFARSGGTWSHQGPKLVGTGAIGTAAAGASVALSQDESTVLVGAPGDNNGVGAAWVFARSGRTWSQQGPKLVGTGATGPGPGNGPTAPEQGSSVALSADGNTALVGGPGDNCSPGPCVGAAWVFVRAGGAWSQQGPKLVGTGATNAAGQGASVALSQDGSTALIGGPSDDCSGSFRGCVGAAWVFARLGGTWSQQGPKLVGTPIGATEQGTSVALSADGSTALVGSPKNYYGPGAAWVFMRSDGIWSQQGPKLVTGETGVGVSVALSADGNTALIGGPSDNDYTGAAWVFVRSGTTWSQQGPKLVGSGAVSNCCAGQGASVALSADGNTALIGSPGDNNGVGAAWVFARSGGTWSQEGPKLVGSGAVGTAAQGSSVALSADGNTVLVGGPGDNNDVGAVWVFALAPDTKITRASIGSRRHRASFRFNAIGTATGFQCALIKQVTNRKQKHHKKPTPRFRSCRSPKLYKRLKPGRYQFLVRALTSIATGTPAKKAFTIV